MKGWQPIETAPKDGTQVLVAWWAWAGRRRGWVYAIRKWTRANGWKPTTAGYQRQPTHWMALPPPPYEQTEPGPAERDWSRKRYQARRTIDKSPKRRGIRVDFGNGKTADRRKSGGFPGAAGKD